MIVRSFLFLCLMFFSAAASGESLKTYPKPLDFVPFENTVLKLERVMVLSSTDVRFGGFSALLKVDDGFLSLTDQGHIARFSNDFSRVNLAPLRKRKGDPLEGKEKTDAESLALGPDGQVYVAFERDHRVLPYDVTGHRSDKKVKLPKTVKDLKINSGLEAIETLQDGRLVLLAEGRSKEAETDLWVQTETGWTYTRLPLYDDFRPTGLTRLPNSDDLILLERFYKTFEGVRIRLSKLDIEQAERTILAELGPPLPLDNFEGITAVNDDTGQTRLFLISDDNFSSLQRTLVMELVLKR